MSFNTFGHLFRVTTFGESHGRGDRLRGRRLPAAHPADRGATSSPISTNAGRASRASPRQRREPDAVKILSGVFIDEATRRASHDGHADCACHRQCRPALEGLFRHQGQIPARATPITPMTSNTASAIIAAAAVNPRARPRCGSPPARSRARSCRACSVRGALIQMGKHKIDRARWNWDEVERNPFFCPDARAGRVLRGLSRRYPQARLLGWRRHRGRGGGRSRWSRRADLWQARRRSRGGSDGHQCRQRRRDRRGLCGGGAQRRGERRRDAHGQRRQADISFQSMRAAFSAAFRPASRSSAGLRSSRRHRS